MKIALASDHAGFQAKEQIKKYLEDKGHTVLDLGTYSEASCDYPDFGFSAGRSVSCGECERGVVICGTGIGISIAANKVKGIRCALCADENCAELCRKHNDANMIAMGARTTAVDKMEKMLDVFLNTPFEGGRHAGRVAKISEIENK